MPPNTWKQVDARLCGRFTLLIVEFFPGLLQLKTFVYMHLSYPGSIEKVDVCDIYHCQ